MTDDEIRKELAGCEATAKEHPSWVEYDAAYVAVLLAEILRLRALVSTESLLATWLQDHPKEREDFNFSDLKFLAWEPSMHSVGPDKRLCCVVLERLISKLRGTTPG